MTCLPLRLPAMSSDTFSRPESFKHYSRFLATTLYTTESDAGSTTTTVTYDCGATTPITAGEILGDYQLVRG